MRASLIQLAVSDAEPPAERRARAAALVRAQQGADLVVLPELWPLGGFAYDLWSDGAETLDGPTSDAMAAAARAAGVWLHAGSIVERDPDGPIYNTSLLFAPDGELVHTYRKIHRFGFDSGEAVVMGAGQEIVTAPTEFATLGLATCYDLRFPELFRALLDAGAQLLVVPAAWPPGGASTGRCWPGRARWRSRRSCWPATPRDARRGRAGRAQHRGGPVGPGAGRGRYGGAGTDRRVRPGRGGQGPRGVPGAAGPPAGDPGAGPALTPGGAGRGLVCTLSGRV